MTIQASTKNASSTADIVGVMLCSMIVALTLLCASMVGSSPKFSDYRLFSLSNNCCAAFSCVTGIFLSFFSTNSDLLYLSDVWFVCLFSTATFCSWNIFMFVLRMRRSLFLITLTLQVASSFALFVGCTFVLHSFRNEPFLDFEWGLSIIFLCTTTSSFFALLTMFFSKDSDNNLPLTSLIHR